jgi:putative addiction module component (TIGR02574 family)
MNPHLLTEILELPVDERIRLVEIIWESVAAVPEAVQISDELRAELDRRLAELEANPEAGVPWEEVRERLGLKKSRTNLAQFFMESPLRGSDLDLTRDRLDRPKLLE